MEKTGVIDPGSQTGDGQTDDRGVPIKNLQAEFARKLDSVKEEMSQKLEALVQKLDSLTQADDAVAPVSTPVQGSYDPREELVRISKDPRRYVEELTQPVREENEELKKELSEQRKAVLTAQWERMEDRIARAEKKSDWNDLSEEFRKEIRQEIVNRSWQNNPASAMDAYSIVKARSVNRDNSDPDRLQRIRDNQPEGAGRGSSSSGTARSISGSMLREIAATPPSHPDYKKNMETLDKVQKGLVKVEA